jgi:hypothetical protein
MTPKTTSGTVGRVDHAIFLGLVGKRVQDVVDVFVLSTLFSTSLERGEVGEEWRTGPVDVFIMIIAPSDAVSTKT